MDNFASLSTPGGPGGVKVVECAQSQLVRSLFYMCPGPQSSAGPVIYIIVGELSITARRIHSIYRKFVRLQGWAVSH